MKKQVLTRRMTAFSKYGTPITLKDIVNYAGEHPEYLDYEVGGIDYDYSDGLFVFYREEETDEELKQRADMLIEHVDSSFKTLVSVLERNNKSCVIALLEYLGYAEKDRGIAEGMVSRINRLLSDLGDYYTLTEEQKEILK